MNIGEWRSRYVIAAACWLLGVTPHAAADYPGPSVVRGWVVVASGTPEILASVACGVGEEGWVVAVVGQAPASKARGGAAFTCSGEPQAVLVSLEPEVGALVPGAAFWRLGVVLPDGRSHQTGRGAVVLAAVLEAAP